MNEEGGQSEAFIKATAVLTWEDFHDFQND